jgi:tetratricopeptide (TPR) repeat protein
MGYKMKKSLFTGSFLFLLLNLPPPAQAQNDHYPQYLDMGNRAYNNQKFDLAVDYYQSALDDKNDCWQAYVGLGNCYYYEKKFKEALDNYQKALKIKPDNPELEKFVAFLKVRLGVVPRPTPTPVPKPLLTPIPGLPPLPPPGPVTPVQKP